MKVKELMELLKGKENHEINLNVKFYGRSVTVSGEDIYVDELDEYGQIYLTTDTKGLNYGFDFDDGKGNLWKK